MKNILVTGGTGYIGSHTALKLLINGYRVIILDSNINSSANVITRMREILCKINPKIINNLTYIQGDLREYQLVKNVFQKSLDDEKSIDSVIHFSGLKSVAESKINPLNYWEVNICSTINLLQIMDEYECRRLIFSSSATVYGEKNKPPFKETFNLNPVSPYANTKASIEVMLNDIFNSKKESWNIVCLRYFNPIGAHESGLLGECPLCTPNNLFPIILNAVIKNEKINVFGNDWPTPDGTCIRDYIHIEDLAEGHIKALEYQFLRRNQFDCYNLGTGKGTSVLELINIFEDVNKVKIPYEITSRREGDTAILVADNSYALNKLNWEPKRSLKKMCKDGYKWITKNPRGYLN